MNTEYHFESTEQRAVEMPFEMRVNGLNSVAKLKAEVFKSSDNKELTLFVDEMRNKRNAHYADNKRFLAAIFYLAYIPTERHELELNQFTREEMCSLIRAINLIRAASPLLPSKLSLPN
ncbi:DUF5347 domain-containing protein [Xenorhabdus doucetiae]|uniref:Phage-related protein n=1 Tax=Xenorhabdus doucetiae TaxID=351671 RepID=A0A068QW11_9GAMM|nr:DUF5347 domain-containing protein [Xenorhabdus doucetiae]TYO94897.1 hypothetical protein LY16_03578 [Xenorhabdus doucetiae]TYP04398.1 hypothetical protein LY16_02202 [Xenorhabdus doucetiae]CDG18565.1 conserved protein of unknown function [Xenorhabdus doucetiae]CDG19143.1 conserved protein of unknown function [Xenorhabdus doucetiae]